MAQSSSLSDTWYYPRPDLVERILRQVSTGRSGRIALFGARRTGKTTLLQREVMPRAKALGFHPVYADCWHDRADPIAGLNYALEQAIDAVPASILGRRMRTEVKKIGALGMSLEFGSEPRSAAPQNPYLAFDWLLARLLARVRKPVLFIADEAQAIADFKEADRVAGAMRTAFSKYEAFVRVVLTGSSELKLAKLLARAKAPLYNFMPRVMYEVLGEGFVSHVEEKFKAATNGRTIDGAEAIAILRMLGHQPAAFLSAVETPLAMPGDSLKDGLQKLLSPEKPTVMTAAWAESTPVQRAVLIAATKGLRLTSEQGRAAIADIMRANAVSGSTIARATESLEQRGLLERDVLESRQARYRVADAVFGLWIEQNLERLASLGKRD